MRQPLLIFVLYLAGTGLQAQINADSIQLLLSRMDDRGRAEYIIANFQNFCSGNFDFAIRMGEKAISIAQKHRWTPLEAAALKNVGVAHYLKGSYESALPNYQKALDAYERIGNPSGQGEVLKEMGNYFKRLKRYDKALEQLARAASLCAEARDTNCLTAALDIKGVVLIEQGKLPEAESVFREEMALLERKGNEQGLSYTLANLAEVAIGKGAYAEAEDYLLRSTAIRKRLGDAPGVAININNTGEMFLRSGQPEKALPYFREAMNKARAIGFNDLQRHAMLMLSETHAAMGRHQEAIQWLKQSYALKDSIFDTEHSRQIAEMAEKYETEKKEKELALRQRQLQSRNFLLALAITGLGLLSLVFTLIFRQQKQRQAQLKREAELKTELLRSELSLRLQDERLRISRDLHDNLGAELTIIGSALARRAAMAPTDADKYALETIGGNARQAMAQLRETIWAIRHEQFSLRDLAEKIGDFAARATDAPCRFSIPEDVVGLSPSQTLNLFRIAQEAITNSAKYAHASTLEVAFRLIAPGMLEMSVSDDGTGFDPEIPPTGNGLENMKSRAEEMGGHILVETSAGAGTRIRARLPLSEPAC